MCHENKETFSWIFSGKLENNAILSFYSFFVIYWFQTEYFIVVSCKHFLVEHESCNTCCHLTMTVIDSAYIFIVVLLAVGFGFVAVRQMQISLLWVWLKLLFHSILTQFINGREFEYEKVGKTCGDDFPHNFLHNSLTSNHKTLNEFFRRKFSVKNNSRKTLTCLNLLMFQLKVTSQLFGCKFLTLETF